MEPVYPSLCDMPFEIIEHIMKNDDLSYADLCQISCVSRAFNKVGQCNNVWRKKYLQMWPNLTNLFDVNTTNWKKEFLIRYKFKKTLAAKLTEMFPKFYSAEFDDCSFQEIKELSKFHDFGWNITVDELQCIINDMDEFHNLTLKYFAKLVFCYMHQVHMERAWHPFLAQKPSAIQILTEGAYLIAKWTRPSAINRVNAIPSVLKSLCDRVFQKVVERSPFHPLIKRGVLSDDMTLEKSLWTPSECRNILCCINAIFFEEMEFHTNNIFNRPEDSLIDEVVLGRVGSPSVIAIIYGIVASRLGVICVPVKLRTGRFYIRAEYTQFVKEPCIFIDMYRKGEFQSCADVHHYISRMKINPNDPFEAVKPFEILAEMCWSIVPQRYDIRVEQLGPVTPFLNVLKLLSVICPDDGLGFFEYPNFILAKDIAKLRRRSDTRNVKYAIGMKMRHKQNYRCLIFDWTKVCEASPKWFRHLDMTLTTNVCNIFYSVLIDGGGSRPVLQDELEIDFTSEPISHSEVGRYFDSFHGTFYKPHELKLREYPDDEDARNRILGLV